MKYKIKHEGLLFVCVTGIITVAVVLLTALLARSMEAFVASILLCNILFWALYILNRAVGLTLIIDEKTLLIKGLFVRRKIRIADIYDVTIENYERKMRSGIAARTYYRMRMRISLVPDKVAILDDNATVKQKMGWEIELKKEKMPDEEVPIYQAYKYLKTMVGKGTVRDLSEEF